jgi:hypothetical protein
MKTPHPIPYQGSKRHIAKYILPFFPQEINTLIEPFAGYAAPSRSVLVTPARAGDAHDGRAAQLYEGRDDHGRDVQGRSPCTPK